MKIFIYLLTFATLLISCGSESSESAETAEAPPPPGEMPPEVIKMAALDQERGLAMKSSNATDGYVLFSSISSSDAYLINKDGEVVHTWSAPHAHGAHYLSDSGHLIINARDPEAPVYSGGGMAGRIYKIDWDSNVLWEYKMADEAQLQHHDIAVMPNGNILAIVWHAKTPEEAEAAGRHPHTIPKAGLWPDKIVEIRPIYPSGGEIIWEWNYWDHLVQEDYPDKPNYGIVAENPGKIHLNPIDSLDPVDPEQFAQNKAMGMTAANASLENRGSDMFHTNAINYNAELDQIALSVPDNSEIWIIDHSLTTEEAATDKGDILYRWGNPEMYHRGDSTNRRLGFQHDVRWVPEGYPDAGKIMIFNNNARKDGRDFTQVLVLDPPMNEDGSYVVPQTGPFEPADASWTYDANDSTDVHAMFISSSNRLQNGNTFVNFGPQGKFVEVTPDGEVVWEYWSPYIGDVKLPGGLSPQPVGPFKFAVFRATHIEANHPALTGKDLAPLPEQPAVAEFPLNQ